jgi:hypothetical protein
VPQIPQPATTPAPAIHISLVLSKVARARARRLIAVAHAKRQDAGKHDQTQIVLLRDAAQHMQHAELSVGAGKYGAKHRGYREGVRKKEGDFYLQW